MVAGIHAPQKDVDTSADRLRGNTEPDAWRRRRAPLRTLFNRHSFSTSTTQLTPGAAFRSVDHEGREAVDDMDPRDSPTGPRCHSCTSVVQRAPSRFWVPASPTGVGGRLNKRRWHRGSYSNAPAVAVRGVAGDGRDIGPGAAVGRAPVGLTSGRRHRIRAEVAAGIASGLRWRQGSHRRGIDSIQASNPAAWLPVLAGEGLDQVTHTPASGMAA